MLGSLNSCLTHAGGNCKKMVNDIFYTQNQNLCLKHFILFHIKQDFYSKKVTDVSLNL